MKLLNNEFQNNGDRFVITENYNHNEFEGKYKLMKYIDFADSWGRIATDDSMRFLYRYALSLRY